MYLRLYSPSQGYYKRYAYSDQYKRKKYVLTVIVRCINKSAVDISLNKCLLYSIPVKLFQKVIYLTNTHKLGALGAKRLALSLPLSLSIRGFL